MVMFIIFAVVVSVIKDVKQIKIIVVLMCLSVLAVDKGFYGTMSDRDLSHFSYEVRDGGPLGYAGVNGVATFEAEFMLFVLGLSALQKRNPSSWLPGDCSPSAAIACCFRTRAKPTRDPGRCVLSWTW